MTTPQPDGISIRTVADTSTPVGRRLFSIAPLLDRLLGINQMDRFYKRHRLAGLPADQFSAAVLKHLDIALNAPEDLKTLFPSEGPLVVVANHPHGGIEGLVLIKLLSELRPDIKILANAALKVFREISSHLLYVNPLKASDPANRRGFRQGLQHLRAGGVLVVFPAGRTSFYQPDLNCIADSEWSRSAAALARKTGAKIGVMRFTGHNSKMFYRLGAIWYRFRLLMLAREMMKMRGQSIEVLAGPAVHVDQFKALDDDQLTEVIRLSSASLTPPDHIAAAAQASERALAPPRRSDAIEAELSALPAARHVAKTKGMIVSYAQRDEIPELVLQIARERERTFRLLDEGSGEPMDTDHYDDEYDHVVCWDHQTHALVGAYRVCPGRALDAASPTYLHRMFTFERSFFTDHGGTLELGRSFITPEFQRNRYALDLLWKGIGGYLLAHPNLKRLYGTVSLTRQYDASSIMMMCDALITPSKLVAPRVGFQAPLPAEWYRMKREGKIDLAMLNTIVSARELDGKGIPVLLRHYAGLNAQFHTVGVDTHFADTPGLLLSVDLDRLPASKQKRYLTPTDQ
ncbi:MAG: lysophospholipid acyltransferase family protein [Pseudomonadota bacterium]